MIERDDTADDAAATKQVVDSIEERLRPDGQVVVNGYPVSEPLVLFRGD